MLSDARHTRRYPVHGRFAGASDTAIRGDLHDVSSTGVCLSTAVSIARGKVVHLEFELPTGIVQLVGEVRWSAPRGERFEWGVRILRIPATCLQAIRAATAWR